MKRKLLLLFAMLFTAYPVFADKVDCGAFADITRPAAKIIMIAAPILTLIFCSVDFLKATVDQDYYDPKKPEPLKVAFNNSIKRIIICVIILLLPIIVNMIISFTNAGDLWSCW